MEENIITQKFYDIINQEDWEDILPDIDTKINTELFSNNDVPLGEVLIPTPIPGLYINLKISFDIDGDIHG